MHIHLETNRIKMHSDSLKVRSLKFENIHCPAKKTKQNEQTKKNNDKTTTKTNKKNFAVALRVCNCYFIWF